MPSTTTAARIAIAPGRLVTVGCRFERRLERIGFEILCLRAAWPRRVSTSAIVGLRFAAGCTSPGAYSKNRQAGRPFVEFLAEMTDPGPKRLHDGIGASRRTRVRQP